MQAGVITNHGQQLEAQDRPDIKPGPGDANIQILGERFAIGANPAPISDLCLTVNKTPIETIIHCRGRITVETAQSLRAAIQPLFSDNNSVVLDLTHVSYTDSAGLGAIVALCASAKAANCGLKLINLNRRLRESLSMARLNELLIDPAFWRTW